MLLIVSTSTMCRAHLSLGGLRVLSAPIALGEFSDALVSHSLSRLVSNLSFGGARQRLAELRVLRASQSCGDFSFRLGGARGPALGRSSPGCKTHITPSGCSMSPTFVRFADISSMLWSLLSTSKRGTDLRFGGVRHLPSSVASRHWSRVVAAGRVATIKRVKVVLLAFQQLRGVSDDLKHLENEHGLSILLPCPLKMRRMMPLRTKLSTMQRPAIPFIDRGPDVDLAVDRITNLVHRHNFHTQIGVLEKDRQGYSLELGSC